MTTDLNITVLRRLLDQRKTINTNIYNVAKSMLKPGTKIEYKANGGRTYFGSVVGIVGIPSTTRVRVSNHVTAKERDIDLADITGLVQEN